MSDHYDTIAQLLHAAPTDRARWVETMRRDDPGTRIALLSAISSITTDIDALDHRRRSLIAFAREVARPPVPLRDLGAAAAKSPTWISDKCYTQRHLAAVTAALTATAAGGGQSATRGVLSIGTDWNSRPALINVPPGGCTVIVVTGGDQDTRNLARDSVADVADHATHTGARQLTFDEHLIENLHDWATVRDAITQQQEIPGNHLVIVTAAPRLVPPNAAIWRMLRYRIWTGSHVGQEAAAARWLGCARSTLGAFTMWGRTEGDALMRDAVDGRRVPPNPITLAYAI